MIKFTEHNHLADFIEFGEDILPEKIKLKSHTSNKTLINIIFSEVNEIRKHEGIGLKHKSLNDQISKNRKLKNFHIL